MTDRMKAGAAAPVGKLTRTADEQALVDAWQAKTRLDWPPRLKDGEEPGTVVADTKDMELWGARLAKAMGVDEPWLLDMLLNQAANCMPGEPARAASVACCASIKTPRPATICHTSDGGAAFGGQAGVKPEAARGGGPKGQALHQLDGRTS